MSKMGYRSHVLLKTTTEGYLVCQKFNDTIEIEEHKPLACLVIKRTASGFYKFEQDYIKWYDSYPNVRNFNKMLDLLEQYDLPYKFIRIGEDYNDIETCSHEPEDTPEQIFETSVEVNIYDPDDYDEDVTPLRKL